MLLLYMPTSQNNRIATQLGVLLYPLREKNEILYFEQFMVHFVEISQIY